MMFVALLFADSLSPLCTGMTGVTRCCQSEEAGVNDVSDTAGLRCSPYYLNRRDKGERQ